MTDADVDGAHIRILLLTLFFRYFPKVIEGGYLYIAQPPLYKISKGKESHYAFMEEDKDEILKKMGKLNKNDLVEIEDDGEGEELGKIKGINIQRYKGLGEMNADQLWETTMNPETRIMMKVEIEEANEADKMFDTLMGGQVEPRKRFIQVHALDVKNLDI